MSDNSFRCLGILEMTRSELLRKLKKLADNKNIYYDFKQERGKGSHGTVYLGDKRSLVPKGEIKTGTLHSIFKNLFIKEQDLNGG